MSNTQQTLAQLVRSKYPGAYDDMDDQTLEKNVLAKYPEYSDLPKTPTQTPQQVASSAGPAQKLSPTPKMFSKDWLKSIFYNQIADPATAALPGAGALAGGIAGGSASGGLGAVGGAGIGGMGGEAAKQLIRRSLGFESPATTNEAAKNIVQQGALQGGIQGVSEGLPFLAGPLQRAAASQYERALAPTTKINKAITQKVAPEMIDRGVHGSLGSIEEQAGQQAASLRPQLDAAYAATPQSSVAGSGSKIIQDLENLKGKYLVSGQPANPAAVDAISNVQQVVRETTQRPGPDVSPESLRQLKSIFDDPVAARGGYAGGDLTTAYTLKAQKAASNSIRSIMGQANPDVAALNKEISFWLDVQRVTQQSGLRRTGQEGGLVRTLALPFLTGTGVAAGMHGGLEGAGAGFLTTAATLAVRSPQWRTASAVLKDRFADALARGSIGDVSALLARLGVAAQGSQQSQQLPWNQRTATTQPSPQLQ